MAKSLIIVESPTKIKTLKKFLGPEYAVAASVGHIKDLPQNELGVDIERDFKPHYITIKGKTKVIKQIKQLSKNTNTVYLAPDPDREGEAISWHIARLIENNGPTTIYRLLFSEITRSGVLKALENPQQINIDKVNAQQTRRILDRLVGYQISPLLWKKVRAGLSAGRVQSVAVRMICEREAQIKAFVPEEYWTITTQLEGAQPPPFAAKLFKIEGKKPKIQTQEESESLLNELNQAEFRVSSITRKEKKRSPVPPFTTSTLQQEASRKLNFSAKKTMTLAQKLYEGIDLGKGEVGLITYMRTDSVRISTEFQNETLDYIKQKYGAEYTPSKPNTYKGKKKSKQKIQDAHEAIRPTSLTQAPEDIGKRLDKDLLRLYTLIWNRYIASQMTPARLDSTIVNIEAARFLFRVTGEVVTFPGFIRVYTEGKDQVATDEGGEATLPPLQEGELLKVHEISHKQNFTQPPPRFTEATLVKTLEENGIGRPSTYAAILSTIVTRKYVVKEKNKFFPTELGILITDLLVESFPQILDVEFTAQMEEQLDSIEDGKLDWIQCLHQFYQPFSDYLEKAKEQMRNVKKEFKETDLICSRCKKHKLVIKWGRNGSFLACPGYPECTFTSNFKEDTSGNITIVGVEQVDLNCEKCGGAFVVKSGRYGRFLACSNYPECKNTREFTQDEQGRIQVSESEATDETCSLCHSVMVIKKGRYGKFLACSNYPKCKFIKPISLGVACPESDCNGYLTEKKSRRGRLFYSCSRYPDCKFATWDKPIPQPCPECKSPYMVIKSTQQTPEVSVCPVCSYSSNTKEDAA